MDKSKVAKKGATATGYGAIGILIEHFAGQIPALAGLPAGTITAAVFAIAAMAQNWLKNRGA